MYVLLLFLGFAATFFRYPQPWRFTLWSEDGGIFFEQAVNGSALDALIRPYAGYLHLFPRAVAEFLSWLPVESVPVATMAIMATATSALAAAVYFLSAAHVRSQLARLVVWALFAAAPIAGMEIAGSLANFQWYLLGGLLLAVFARREGWIGGAISAAVVLVGFGSSVLALLFLPFVVLRALTFRRKQDLLILTLAVVVSAVQLAGVLSGSRAPLPPAPSVFELVRTYLIEVINVGWLGPYLAEATLHAGGTWAVGAALWVVTVTIAVLVWRRTRLAAVALLVSVTYFVPVMVITGLASVDPTEQFTSGIGSRYLFFPVFAVGMVIAAAIDVAVGRRRVVLVACAIALVLLQLVAIATSFRAFDPRAYHLKSLPAWSTSVDEARQDCADGASIAFLRGDETTLYDWDTIIVSCSYLDKH